MARPTLIALGCVLAGACGPPPQQPAPTDAPVARNVVLVTIDTLRADRVGAYGLHPTTHTPRGGDSGWASARTPVMDGLARDGVRFTRAYATAPITLTSHASLMTGRYPAGHGARHNGIAMDEMPTVATRLHAAGFATAAFVSAFPLDRRFGLARGFAEYDDALGRGADGRLLNERPASETVARAIAWLDAHRTQRFFLWVHLFEPHAPYGDPPAAETRKSMRARYDEEVAIADAETGRLIAALGDLASSTWVIVTSDHGEAFGEHGEIGHSIFVYDTTLRVPLILRGPRVPQGRTIDAMLSLVDLAPTMLAALGQEAMDVDGVSLMPLLDGQPVGERAIYAESFAPFFDFGWSPLRSARDQGWKYIAAPKPELFDLANDAGEQRNLVERDPPRASRMAARVQALGVPLRLGSAPTAEPRSGQAHQLGSAETAEPRSGQAHQLGSAQAAEPRSGQARGARAATTDFEARRRLEALGYVSGGGSQRESALADPKDRIEIASRLATVMAGEVQGPALVSTLEAILKDDPSNPQAHLRLAYAHLQSNRCDRAVPHFRSALMARLPSADAGLGLADCHLRSGDFAAALTALREADAVEPGNPVVQANLGLIALQANDEAVAVMHLTAALASDPTLLEARFALARAFARQGRREDAAREAKALLHQLPPNAPQRAEIERLLSALR